MRWPKGCSSQRKPEALRGSVGTGVEVAVVAFQTSTPGLQDAFHMVPLTGWQWLFLLAPPPLVLGAEVARKALVRRFAHPRRDAGSIGPSSPDRAPSET